MQWPKSIEEARLLLGQKLRVVIQRKLSFTSGALDALPCTVYAAKVSADYAPCSIHLLVFGVGFPGIGSKGDPKPLSAYGWTAFEGDIPEENGWTRLTVQDADIYELDGVADKITKTKHKCVCSMRDLMMLGCKCGGV
jgi:hypothetical protein